MSRAVKLSCQSLLLLLLLLAASSSTVFPSQELSQRPKEGPSAKREIPPATLPTTPAEAAWWEDLRTASETVRKSRGRKGTQDLLRLIREGQTQAYAVPIPDSKPMVLSLTMPQYTESARVARISGSVQLSVEFRSDGLVGEVSIATGLRSDLDQSAIEAARRTAFLPAVKDRKFVTETRPMEMSFRIY